MEAEKQSKASLAGVQPLDHKIGVVFNGQSTQGKGGQLPPANISIPKGRGRFPRDLEVLIRHVERLLLTPGED